MELIAIGKILKPVGTRGAMKIEPLTHVPERFQKLQKVWIGTSAENATESAVISVEVHASQVVLAVETVQSIEDVDAYRNGYVFVRSEERITPASGSYFIDAIIGCNVYDEKDGFVGIVTDVLSLPANDVWLVRRAEREILLPAVKYFVRSVDVDKKRIIIHVVEGLLE